jgi:hypothetical protein
MWSVIKWVGFGLLYLTAINQAIGQQLDENLSDLENETVFVFDVGYIQPIPVGNNYAGEGLSGRSGLALRGQIYFYKGIYVGGALNWEYLRVKNPELIGAYRKTTKKTSYFYAGYDYRFKQNWRATLDVGYGYIRNRNRSFTRGGFGGVGSDEFFDDGNLLRITSSFEYQFPNSDFSVFLSPAIEFASMNIEAPAAQRDFFQNTTYISIAAGIRLRSNKYGRELKPTDMELMDALENRNYDDLSIKEKRELYFLRKRQKRSGKPNGDLKNQSDQKRLEFLLSQDNDDLTISERRELLKLKKKLKRQSRKN